LFWEGGVELPSLGGGLLGGFAGLVGALLVVELLPEEAGWPLGCVGLLGFAFGAVGAGDPLLGGLLLGGTG
jgi:hypothetical protein